MQKIVRRSTDGVRAYKRSSEGQQQELSKVLNRERAVCTTGLLLYTSITDTGEKENRPSTANIPSITLSSCTRVTINVNHLY